MVVQRALKATNICSSCNGSGHDRQSKPVVKITSVRTTNGIQKKHTTLKQGSGCISCLGLGKLS